MRRWIKEKKEKEVRKCAHDGNENTTAFCFWNEQQRLPSQRNKHIRPRARTIIMKCEKEWRGERTELFDHATCFCKYGKKKDFLSQKQSNVQLRKRIMRIIKLHQWLWIYENRIFVLRLINVYESDLRRNEHYPSSIENKVWKKFRPLRDMNLWPVRDMNLWPVRYQTLIHRFTGLLLTNIMANSQLAC